MQDYPRAVHAVLQAGRATWLYADSSGSTAQLGCNCFARARMGLLRKGRTLSSRTGTSWRSSGSSLTRCWQQHRSSLSSACLPRWHRPCCCLTSPGLPRQQGPSPADRCGQGQSQRARWPASAAAVSPPPPPSRALSRSLAPSTPWLQADSRAMNWPQAGEGVLGQSSLKPTRRGAVGFDDNDRRGAGGGLVTAGSPHTAVRAIWVTSRSVVFACRGMEGSGGGWDLSCSSRLGERNVEALGKPSHGRTACSAAVQQAHRPGSGWRCPAARGRQNRVRPPVALARTTAPRSAAAGATAVSGGACSVLALPRWQRRQE